jgi:hypothetical protein
MPLPMLAIYLVGTLSITVLATFWADICEWFAERASPWLEAHVPSLAPHIKKAFIFIDDKVMVPMRRAIKRAWAVVRQHLLEATVTYFKQGGEWVRRIDSYLQEKLGAHAKVIKRTEESTVEWDELPESVRAAAMSRKKSVPINFVKTRDAELQAMELS